ncbi:MAG: hypothetical protein MPJ50_12450 [Pirellulales bacterium]|nr:hypothetical protein [Pirellulales bacterium]
MPESETANTNSAQHAVDVIKVFDHATALNRSSAGRQGNVVALTSETADDVLITADLHGRRERFAQILDVAALAEHPRRHLVLQEVCHGGPTYSGELACMSHQLLEDVGRLKAEYPERVHFLMSNHELAELTDYPIMKGGKLLNMTFRLGLQHAYGRKADEVHGAYSKFLRSCPLALRLEQSGIFISHSIPSRVDRVGFDTAVFDRELRDSDLTEFGPAFELVWGRDYRSDNAAAFARLVRARLLITGHEPCREGFAMPNPYQTILDCCGDTAAYLLLPVGQELSMADIKSRMQTLENRA